jgi:hypothetical protein
MLPTKKNFDLKMVQFVTKTYSGKSGCACGCGGNYADGDSTTGKKRITKMLNSDCGSIEFFDLGDGEGCFDLENFEGTRVLRVYVKEGA